MALTKLKKLEGEEVTEIVTRLVNEKNALIVALYEKNFDIEVERKKRHFLEERYKELKNENKDNLKKIERLKKSFKPNKI